MTGRIALVTGGSRGIGRAIAFELGRAGHRVAITYARDESGADETVQGLKDLGAEATAVRGDSSDPHAVDGVFSHVETTFGKPEILVNNAGVNADGLLLRMSDDQWRTVLSTNLDGCFYAIRRAASGMVRARFGRIVNITSVAGLSGSAGQANYAAAKAGVVGLTRTVARELASRGITCNVVAPGPITTAMTDALSEDRRVEMSGQVPLGRFGTVDEVAATVAFLCSEPAGYITGAVIPVDGGLGMGH